MQAGGAFRLIYVARFPEAVYVLHVFSLDALVNIASKAGMNVRLVVKKAA